MTAAGRNCRRNPGSHCVFKTALPGAEESR